MRKYLVIFCLCLAHAALGANTAITVGGLKCENLTAPLAIDNTTPRFSWKLYGTKAGQDQTAYQIEVSLDSLFLKKRLWNSGKVESAESVMIPYGGIPLKSRDQCYWRVRVWTGDKASGWSPVACFGVGLTDSRDIQGSYIGYPSSGKTAVLLRKKFDAPASVETALLHVNSLGYHEVYIDGRKISDDVLSPAISQMNVRPLYVTYDVAPYLSQGANEIVIWLGQGWYKKNTFGRWDKGEPYTEPLVRAQLDVLEEMGWETVCKTDSSWETCLTGYTDTGSWNAIDFGGELVDARANPVDMRPETLDALPWREVITADMPQYKATAQMCEPNRIRETLTAKTVTKGGDGVWLVDMGKVITGWFEMDFTGLSAGDTVRIEYRDEINPALRDLDQRQSDTYIARGGSEKFINKFNHHAFRYVTITGLKGEPAKESMKSHLIHTDYAAASSFECSDPDLNAIHDMIQYTMRCLAYSGYMVDCPHLERAGYGGDGNSSTESLQTMFDVSPLYKNWVQAWGDFIKPDGSLPHIAPNVGGGGGGPYWCGFIVMAPWQTYLNYGDRRLMEQFYGAMQQWLGYVDEYTVDGLLRRWPDTEYRGWYLGDWLTPHGVDAGNETSVTFVNNCFISDCFDKMGKMAVLLGKADDAKMYVAKKETLNRLLHEKFFDPQTNTYATGSQLDMTYPMLVGVTPADIYEKVKETLLADNHMKGHIGGGLVGVPIITKWAIRNRATDWIFTMLKKRDYPGYLYMMDNGATTTWESWDGERSRVHNCYNGIGMWFYQALGGLRTDEATPGYRNVIIDPQIPEGVTWSKVTKETPYGTIKLDWTLEDGTLSMDMALPAGITANVIVPENAVDCRIDGKKHSLKKGSPTIGSGAHKIIFGVRQ